MSSVNGYGGGDFYSNLALLGRAFTDQMQEALDKEIAAHEAPDPSAQPGNKAPAKPPMTPAAAKVPATGAPAANLLSGASTIQRAATGNLSSLPFEAKPRAATPGAPPAQANPSAPGASRPNVSAGASDASRSSLTLPTTPSGAPSAPSAARATPQASAPPPEPQETEALDFSHFAEPEAATPEAKYAALPASQKTQFDAIARALAPAPSTLPAARALPGSANPAPALPPSLGRLLAAGRFDGPSGGQLLGALSQLASVKLGPALAGRTNNARLVGEALAQIENPLSVRQSARQWTSGEAALERQLIEEDPARYVAAIAELAGEAQSTTLPNGKPLALAPGAAHVGDDESLLSSLLQGALHEAFTEGGQLPLGKALFNSMWQALFPGSGGRAIAVFEVGQQALALTALQRGDVAIIDGLPGSNLKQAVTIVSKNLASVTFVDPDGNVVTVPASAFIAHLRGAVLRPDAGVTDEASAWEVGNDGSWPHFDPETVRQPRKAKAPPKRTSIWGKGSKHAKDDDDGDSEGEDWPWYFIRRVER